MIRAMTSSSALALALEGQEHQGQSDDWNDDEGRLLKKLSGPLIREQERDRIRNNDDY
jgi:hypothetical protein